MDKLEKLISAYCDGNISDQDSQELESILAKSSEARQKLIEYINIDAGLKEIADAENDIIAFPKEKIQKKTSAWLYAAAALLVINLALLFQPTKTQTEMAKAPVEKPQTETQIPDFNRNAIAQITRAVNTEFVNENSKTLNPGKLKLESGLLQIEFFSGATMVLEGPAEIELISAMEVTALSGKMHVKVPETAQGFIVDTGKMQVHDLGTEFAIDMNKPSPEVHVLDGEVEIHHDKKKLKTLLKSDSIAWNNSSESVKNIESREDFISYRQIGQVDNYNHQNRQQEWLSYLNELKSRDDLLLLYDFQQEEDWQRTLQNQAPFGKMEGAIIGAQWSEGRWQGKSALDFKSINARIRLNIPGEYTNMTMACWVRIDSFDRWLSSLLLTDGFKKGSLHWQLSDIGEMILGSKFSDQRNSSFDQVAYNVFSPQVIQLDDMGQWIHIAVVYDHENAKITHYLNGGAIHSEAIDQTQTIVLGNSEIGNWNHHRDNSKDIRSLNGRMDEFLIFSSALSSDEIKNIYAQGKP